MQGLTVSAGSRHLQGLPMFGRKFNVVRDESSRGLT
jgi:hypothetical protein